MALKDTLMDLEQKFWEASSAANSDLIRSYLTDDALMVGNFGVLDKETTATVAEGQSPFSFWHIDSDPQLVPLTDDSAVIIYRATAQREGREPFTILISSTYVYRHDHWVLACHHQTPV